LCSDAKDGHMYQSRHKMSLLECQVGRTVIALTETGTRMTGKTKRSIRDLGYIQSIINSGVQQGVQILAWG
jgi:hypothetical protein